MTHAIRFTMVWFEEHSGNFQCMYWLLNSWESKANYWNTKLRSSTHGLSLPLSLTSYTARFPVRIRTCTRPWKEQQDTSVVIKFPQEATSVWLIPSSTPLTYTYKPWLSNYILNVTVLRDDTALFWGSQLDRTWLSRSWAAGFTSGSLLASWMEPVWFDLNNGFGLWHDHLAIWKEVEDQLVSAWYHTPHAT